MVGSMGRLAEPRVRGGDGFQQGGKYVSTDRSLSLELYWTRNSGHQSVNFEEQPACR